MTDEKSPWVKGNLVVYADVLEAVDEEARRGYAKDEESCGLLAGPGDEGLLVDRIIPFENRANKLHALDPETYPRTGRMYFDIDPIKFEREIRERARVGAPVKVLYHSHLDVGAYFSETDAQAATMGGPAPTYPLAYLVTSVRKGVVDDRKLFVWLEGSGKFVESPLRIQTRSAAAPGR
jgi:proteasome lid subunit RPN8/RPN11